MNHFFLKLKKADYRAEFFNLANSFQKSVLHHLYTQLGRAKFRMAGVRLGKNVSINGKFYLSRFKHSTIIIGDNCIFNAHDLFNTRGTGHCIIRTHTDYALIEIGINSGFSGVSINACQSIKIGKNVIVGKDTAIFDNDGHPERLGTGPKPVVIGDNVFIGMRCIIMKGVTIGNNAIIGSGSIVTKDIPANSVAAGVPCKVIRLL